MTLEEFRNKLKMTPEVIQFSETINVIDIHYDFTPTAFKNGALFNDDNQNLGSCKVLAFAKDQNFTKAETLACFGQFYFNDVLNDPKGDSHQNIRNFMNTGFEDVIFEGVPLKRK